MAKVLYKNIVGSGKNRYQILTHKPMRKGHRTELGRVIRVSKIKRPTLFQRMRTGD